MPHSVTDRRLPLTLPILVFVPMACLAAARALPERHLRPVLVVMAVQALAIEVLFRTMW